MSVIRTPRLELVNASMASLRAELEGRDALARVLGVDVPGDWPPELYGEHGNAAVQWVIGRLEAEPDAARFLQYYFVEAGERRTLVGVGGFKGAPADGVVELGYEVLEPYRRRGYATEATAGMLAFAFSHEHVHTVVAHTLPHLTSSIGVLERTGFRYSGQAEEEGMVVIGFAIGRDEWRRRQPTSGSVADKLARVDAHWSPKRIARVNDTDVKVVRIRGEFVWHHHEAEDEMFLVVSGRLLMQFRDRDVWLGPGEFVVVPRGVEHRPVAPEEVEMMLVEPASTLNTGNLRNERTVAEIEAI